MGKTLVTNSPRKVRSSVRLRESSSHQRLSCHQNDELEKYFSKNEYPEFPEKMKISRNLGIQVDKVTNWFQNKRAKLSRPRSDTDVSKLTSASKLTRYARKARSCTNVSKPSKPVLSLRKNSKIDTRMSKTLKSTSSSRKTSRKISFNWPMELEGPIFHKLDEQEETCFNDLFWRYDINDEITKKISATETWKDLSKICQTILDKFSDVEPMTEESFVENHLFNLVDIMMGI